MMANRLRNALNSAALASVILAAGLSGSALSGERGGVEAKIEYCQICHGQSGQGFYGYYPIPRLAGQQQAYIENQLRDYASGLRHNSIMGGVARGVAPGTMGTIAAHFHGMNPPPLGASGGNAALGREIFSNGLPEANIPACSACHGPDGHGTGAIPRLAGQLPSYLVKTLSNWSAERGRESAGGLSAIMVPTTHNMNAAQIAAVAAYVGGLR